MNQKRLVMASVHPLFREALCVWQFFRKLEFTSDEVRISYDTSKNEAIDVYIFVDRGDEHYAIRIGEVRGATTEMIQTKWEAACALLQFTPESELEAMWEASKINAMKVPVLANLVAQGFKPPTSS